MDNKLKIPATDFFIKDVCEKGFGKFTKDKNDNLILIIRTKKATYVKKETGTPFSVLKLDGMSKSNTTVKLREETLASNPITGKYIVLPCKLVDDDFTQGKRFKSFNYAGAIKNTIWINEVVGYFNDDDIYLGYKRLTSEEVNDIIKNSQIISVKELPF